MRQRGNGHSPLRQASQTQAGDVEFENFRCQKLTVLAKAGDGELGVDGKHSTEFGSRCAIPTPASGGCSRPKQTDLVPGKGQFR